MPDPLIEIPNRTAFKAAEVCEIAHIPPYVLRSWEKEFPNLGVVARPGGPRVYRRGDIEQILRIKQLVFSEGLTLAGARRKLEGDPPPEPEPAFDLPLPEEVRARVGKAKHELRSLLDLLAPPKASAQDVPAPSGSRGAGDMPGAQESVATWPPMAPRAIAAPVDPDPVEPPLPLLDAGSGVEGATAPAEVPPPAPTAASRERVARKRKRPE